MSGTPQTTANDLVEDVNRLIAGLTEFVPLSLEIRKLLKRIESLKSVRTGEAFLLLGQIQFALGDVAAMREAMRVAEQYCDPVLFGEGMVPTLVNFGFFSEAQRLAQVSANATTGKFLAFLPVALRTGIFSHLAEQMAIFENKMQLDAGNDLHNQVAKAFAVASRYGLTDSAIGKTLDIVGDVYRSNKLPYAGDIGITTWGLNEFEDVEPHICFDFSFARSPTKVVDLCDEFVNRLVSSPLGRLPDGLVIRFSTATERSSIPMAA